MAFERHCGVAVACGDPICPPGFEQSTVVAFLDWCKFEKLTPAFTNVLCRSLENYRSQGLSALKVGEEPLFDAGTYAPRGDRAKKVRSAANQARKSGAQVETAPAGSRPGLGLEREMQTVVQEWRASRQVKALGFTLRLSPLRLIEDKILVTARRVDGRLEGFLTCVPYEAGSAYYVEDLIRRPDAANGISELLVLAAIEECRRRGAETTNLGLAPLRGSRLQPGPRPVIGRAMDFAFRKLNLFYRFKPLEHFKGKFAPSSWEDAFIVYPRGSLPRVALGVLSAFTPGKAGPLTAVVSRFRLHGRESGPEQPRPGQGPILATLAASGVIAVAAYLAPETAERLAIDLTQPLLLVESAARAHLMLDALIVAVGGGWMLRSRR